VVRVHIDSIAAGGDGVGRLDGLVVFVPRSAPGDLVEVRLEGGDRFARGEILRMVEPSPGRVSPRCSHYEGDACGGCQLQHLGYDGQLAAKRRIVTDALERIARREARSEEVVASPRAWEYRTKLTLAIREGAEHRIIGLRRRNNPDAIFPLRECPITHARVVAAWREVQLAEGLLPRMRTMSGAIRVEGGDLLFDLNGGAAWPQSREFASACPSLSVVRWQPHGGRLRTVIDRRASPSAVAAFRQVNPEVAALLLDAVQGRVMAHTPSHCIDAYSGEGELADRLARAGVSVTAIELDAAASAIATARLPNGARAVTALVEDALPQALPADVVVVNPPRSGVDARVTSTLAAAAPPPRAIVYVSCNPATLARDISRLPGWRVAHLQPFDMFPQTAHVETLCELVPEAP
jgi:23S rRNA (uracil1939-C5)-methyltransferase